MSTITVKANGFDFAVDEEGSGDKLALFLHGFPESRFSWRYQLPLFAELGYRAWAPDLRGYGQTRPRPKGVANYHIDKLCEDVAALIDASGAKEVVLVAHDWGAIIAWTFASRKIRPLARLIIMNVPHPAVFSAMIGKSAAQQRRSWYVAFFQIPFLPELFLGAGGARGVANAFSGMAVDKSRFPPEVTDVYVRNAREPGALTAMINYYRALARARDVMSGEWPVIETPTLIVWGEEDSALGMELLPGHDEYVKDLTLQTLPQVSHWVQQEAPEKVNEIVRAWMSTARPAQKAEESAL
jgi:pimeloyl-ACP methyl ester carboxylesterase